MSKKKNKQNQKRRLTVGLPIMNVESGEKRDFLPDFIAHLEKSELRFFWKKVTAAIRYGDAQRWKAFADQKIPRVEVTVIDDDLTAKIDVLLEILPKTDILVDATQRPDPSVPMIANDLKCYLP